MVPAEYETKSGGPSKHGSLSGSTICTPMKSALGIREHLGPGFWHPLGIIDISQVKKNLKKVSLFAQGHTGSMFVCAQGRKRRDQRLLCKYWSEAGTFRASIVNAHLIKPKCRNGLITVAVKHSRAVTRKLKTLLFLLPFPWTLALCCCREAAIPTKADTSRTF